MSATAKPMVGEFLPNTDGIYDGPPAGTPDALGNLVLGASSDTWKWESSSAAWPDTFFVSVTTITDPTHNLVQSDTAQTFPTGSSSAQSVSIGAGDKVWQIEAHRKKVGGFDIFDPIGFIVCVATSLDDTDLKSKWLKVDKDSCQHGIAYMFPNMPANSFLKFVRLSSPPSTLSFTGWVGVDV